MAHLVRCSPSRLAEDLNASPCSRGAILEPSISSKDLLIEQPQDKVLALEDECSKLSAFKRQATTDLDRKSKDVDGLQS